MNPKRDGAPPSRFFSARYLTLINILPGEGDPNADLMFIGEGPGAEEDRLGRPFVGLSLIHI